jgi:hypothetical protein
MPAEQGKNRPHFTSRFPADSLPPRSLMMS